MEPAKDEPFSENEFRELFWLIFETLNDDIKLRLRSYWQGSEKYIGSELPVIYTDQRLIDAWKVKYGAANACHLFFSIPDLSRKEHPLIIVVYHEIAHCYLNALGKYYASEITDATRVECEKKTISLSKKWFANLAAKRRIVAELRQNNVVEKASATFWMKPVF